LPWFPALSVVGFQPKVVMLMFSLRRATAVASTVVVLVGAVAVAQAANEAKKRSGNYQPSNNDKIYDLSVPWPFREKSAPGDIDGDGVVDEKDRCPGTSRGAIVDQFGCPTDSDGDGVADGLDRCPNTSRGARVDAQGCPADADRDGVADGVDQCANTPRGAIVDSRGCPKDSDNDGVVDGVDKCADTPREYAVDDEGCPIPIGEVGQRFLDSKSVAFNIEFASGKDEILPQSEADLDRVGEVLSDWPDAKVEIAGYTDSQGAESFNKSLSKRRADAVKKYLTDKFSKIESGNLSTKGHGESNPIADNGTPEGRAQNRRVEFTLMNAKELGKEVDTRRYKKRAQ
jgi:OOP family OmpA-OmpF porin